MGIVQGNPCFNDIIKMILQYESGCLKSLSEMRKQYVKYYFSDKSQLKIINMFYFLGSVSKK